MFSKLLSKFKDFMFGRNGPDQLTYALLITAFVLYLVFSLLNWTYLMLVPFIPMGFAAFRLFSKELERRRLENQAFLNLLDPSVGWFKGRMVRMKDSKTHKYFKCPNCKATVRVPKGKGTVRITCPRCGDRFQKRT